MGRSRAEPQNSNTIFKRLKSTGEVLKPSAALRGPRNRRTTYVCIDSLSAAEGLSRSRPSRARTEPQNSNAFFRRLSLVRTHYVIYSMLYITREEELPICGPWCVLRCCQNENESGSSGLCCCSQNQYQNVVSGAPDLRSLVVCITRAAPANHLRLVVGAL
jgi:hypothetical protein